MEHLESNKCNESCIIAWRIKSSDLFEKYIHKYDKKISTQGGNVAIIVDNFLSHKNIEGKVFVDVCNIQPAIL